MAEKTRIPHTQTLIPTIFLLRVLKAINYRVTSYTWPVPVLCKTYPAPAVQ